MGERSSGELAASRRARKRHLVQSVRRMIQSDVEMLPSVVAKGRERCWVLVAAVVMGVWINQKLVGGARLDP